MLPCRYAHGPSELRGGSGQRHQMTPSRYEYTSAMPSGESMMMAKRKRENFKTLPCQNYAAYGECQFGDSCNYLHEEFEMSKRQRFWIWHINELKIDNFSKFFI